MDRTVKREYIDRWIDEAYPNALTKLSLKSELPASSISKIRNGRVPKSKEDRDKLAKALGVEESALFPSAKGKSEAS